MSEYLWSIFLYEYSFKSAQNFKVRQRTLKYSDVSKSNNNDFFVKLLLAIMKQILLYVVTLII